MSHCDYCRRGKKRKQLRALINIAPNITSTRAAALLDLDRPYATTSRLEMERRGCVAKRTIDGRRQALLERAQVRSARPPPPVPYDYLHTKTWPIGAVP